MDQPPAPTPKWTSLPYHRAWLLGQAEALFDFFEPHAIDPAGGFFSLDERGRPIRATAAGPAPARQIHATARMVHCFAIARLLGRPGADAIIDHGMAFLWNGHRDRVHGGYMWSIGADGDPQDATKQAYGHAFVLLAASSACVAGHPNADRLLADASEVIRARFWEPGPGAAAEQFAQDWTPIGRYRGQNANMHLTEALMAAFEATGDGEYLAMAGRIATLILDTKARAHGWRVPEHYDDRWTVDREAADGDIFRPFGTTPGHSLEWTRLVLQLWELGGRRAGWMPEAARALFAEAVAHGWNGERGGFHYTLDWDRRPFLRNRLWWPAAEGIGAAHFLNRIDGDALYEDWYRRIWDFVAGALIDREQGGWRTDAADPEEGARRLFDGRPDLYHALQACLIPLLPTTGSITRGVAEGQLAT